MRRVFFLSPLLGVYACVGDSPIVPNDGGQDATSQDAAADNAVTDGNPQPEAEASGPFDGNLFGNLELWISADHGVTDTDAGVVSGWTDRSTKARTLSVPPSDPNCQAGPTLAAIAIHGLPAIQFNGGTQCLTASGTFSDFTSGFMAFVVLAPGNCNSQFTGNNGGVFSTYDDSQSSYVSGISIHRNYAESPQNATGDGMLSIDDLVGNGDVGLTGAGTWVPNTPALLEFRLPAAAGGQLISGTAYVNGTFQANLNPNNPFSPDLTPRNKTYIGYNARQGGGSALYCGLIGEMLIYSKALTDNDRMSVEAYLKPRWGL